jgi:pimeloyl-ACP methyl ester carboxylesterase
MTQAHPSGTPESARASERPTALVRFESTPHRYIDVGHSKVAAWRYGQGPHLLFVHGWPLHSATYRGLLPHLARSFTCHLIDFPGCGATLWDENSKVGVVPHAQTIRQVIEELALPELGIVSHDSGAAIARLVAADNPRVKALVFGNTEIPGHHSPLMLMLFATAKLPGGLALFSKLIRSRAFRRAVFGYGGCFHDRSLLDGEFFELLVKPLLDDPRALQGQLRLLQGISLSAFDALAKIHPKISAPTLLIWGEGDPFFPVSRVPAMLPQFGGGAELRVLDRSKLLVHEERAPEFAALAAQFFARYL